MSEAIEQLPSAAPEPAEAADLGGSSVPIAGRAVIMLDVARVAGVSIQTVSRVLNASPSVRDATRSRVLGVVQELGYRPNAIARALVNRRAAAIGVVAVDTRNHGPITTLLALERAARSAGYGLTVVTPDSLTREGFAEAYQALLSYSVAGAVLIAPQDLADPPAPPPGLPIVAVETDAIPGVPAARIEQRTGVAAAVRHLVGLGHRRIDHICGPLDWPEARERLAGWQQMLTESGLAVPPVVRGDWTAESGYRWALDHAADPEVTAVVAANDQVALGVLRGCWEIGVSVPGQLSVVGFDDVPEAAWSIPSLTTVRQDLDALGGTAVAMLLHLLGPAEPDSVVAPPPLPELVIRESTGAPAH
jgi:DNA-binding LacI/PurR family transcriptional regulator